MRPVFPQPAWVLRAWDVADFLGQHHCNGLDFGAAAFKMFGNSLSILRFIRKFAIASRPATTPLISSVVAVLLSRNECCRRSFFDRDWMVSTTVPLAQWPLCHRPWRPVW